MALASYVKAARSIAPVMTAPDIMTETRSSLLLTERNLAAAQATAAATVAVNPAIAAVNRAIAAVNPNRAPAQNATADMSNAVFATARENSVPIQSADLTAKAEPKLRQRALPAVGSKKSNAHIATEEAENNL